MPDLVEDLWKRFTKARDARMPYETDLRLAFEHGAPSAGSAFGTTEDTARRRTRQVFDASTRRAVRDGAAALQSQIAPPTGRWMELRVAPHLARRLEAGGQDVVAKDMLAKATAQMWAELEVSNFYEAMQGPFRAAHIADGCVLFLDVPPSPLSASAYHFDPVPAHRLYIEPTSAASPRTVFRCQSVAAGEVKEVYPYIDNIPPDLAKIASEDRTKMVEIVDGAVFDPEQTAWRYVVMWNPGSGPSPSPVLLAERQDDSNPFILIRMDAAAGEPVGYGPVRDLLSDILTTNKLVEMILKNLALAVSGMWKHEDDGVFNPSAVRLVPGAVITYASGGRGLEPLTPGIDFNPGNLAVADYRASTRDGIMGREPPVVDKSHIAALAVEREHLRAQLLRLPRDVAVFKSLAVPLARRAHLINVGRGTAPDLSDLGDVGGSVIPSPVGPWARAGDQAELIEALEALERVKMFAPAAADAMLRDPAFVRWMIEKSGIQHTFIPTEAAIAQAFGDAQDAAEAMALAEGAGKAAPMVQALRGKAEN